MSFRFCWAVLLLTLVAVDSAGEGTLQLRYANGTLSLRADQMPVKTLWQKLAQAAGFRLHVAEGVSEAPASWSFSNVPVAEALARLVTPNDFAIFYEPVQKPNQAARISDLFIFPPSPPATGSSVAPAALYEEAEARSEAQRLGRLIAAPGEVALRRLAVADLLALNSPEVAKGLEMALGATEPEMRREVVQALGEVDRDIPPTALGQVVIGDRDALVRQEAIRVLADLGSEVARLFIEQAMKDKDENVREAARRALSGMSVP